MAKDTIFERKQTMNVGGKIIDLSTPVVMGILNVTPDSFYDGGEHQTEKAILNHTEKLLSEGAAIIDIGAYSSRPGAENISEEEELKRLLPALTVVRNYFKEAIISVDTFRSCVARKAVLSGADMINDISGGQLDKDMFETIAGLRVPYVLMHMQRNPQTMQHLPDYKNVVLEVAAFFSACLEELKILGVNDVIIDPGFGFGKTVAHNYQLLKNLQHFNMFGMPLLAGVSRKSMVNKVIDTKPEAALNGTTVVNTIALLEGASILRVHDVKEAVEAIKIVNFMRQTRL